MGLPPVAAFVSLIACLGAGPEEVGADLLIVNARLFDAAGAQPRDGISILIRDGRIAEIGPEVDAPNARRLDAGGGTVLPGLIDAHVHLASSPGAPQRGDDAETTRALRRHHFRAYLACGVTTVLDTGCPLGAALELQMTLRGGHPAPRVLMLSPVFTARGGYVTHKGLGFDVPGVGAPEEVPVLFEATEWLKPVGVKVTLESGFVPEPSWPIITPEVREAVVREAKRRGLPLFVHGGSEAEDTIGLDMGAKVFVHAGLGGRRSEGWIRRMKESGASVISTLAIYDSFFIRTEPQRLEDELVRLVVPEAERKTASDEAAFAHYARTWARTGMPSGTDEDRIAAMVETAKQRLPSAALLDEMKDNVRRLHEAGVPIVAGSDSGNWPVIPYEFHGPTSIRELELLGGAGLTPAEVIIAATRTPAQLLGLADEIGTVEVGKQADLIVTRDDPLKDLRALRRLRWSIRGGVARTPEEWMRTGPEAE
jgi:imidazolonepropionase-like amidohydrolase